MIEAGLVRAGKGMTLDTWQPYGRDKPVISEDYMKPAVIEYKRRQAGEGRPGRGKNILAIIGVVLALAVLYATVLAKDAEARPSRVTVNEAATFLT
jgi:hypothetical protein